MCVCVYLCLCLCPCLCLCLCVSVYVYVEIENWKTNSICWNWRWIAENGMKFVFKIWCKIDSKMNKNPPNLDLQGWFGGPRRPLWRQDGPRCELDLIWGWIWRRLGAHLVAKMAQVGPKWHQDGAMLANLEPKMVNLAPFWEASWIIFRILSAILAKIAEV